MTRKSIIILVLAALVASGLWAGGKQEQSLPFEQRYQSMSWEQIVDEAGGQKLYWYMWGGSDLINKFVNGYLAERLRNEYDITLEMVPVTDAATFINKVLGEKQARRDSGGSVDMMWINGENFRTTRDADLLFGPYADKLPHMQYIDSTDSSISNDFGFPVEGYESPYGSAQVVMVYDSARVPEPPRKIEDLLDWIRANPGKFTYPAIPDFTGSVFVRHLFYHVAGGYEQLLGSFDQELFDRIAPKLWQLLNELEPYLWREGNTYPETHTLLQDLFANGEVYFDVTYNPSEAASLVSQGRYPESARTFVFDSGTIGNTHYVAISYNSSSKAAAMVLANLLLDPATQYEKSRPEVWGDLTVLSVGSLPRQWREKFGAVPRPPSVLSPDELSSHKIPELQATWLEAIERGWTENVLQK
ncbi:MAG: ABC transporter substrate-binding protein [Spirochaetia bacterium]